MDAGPVGKAQPGTDSKAVLHKQETIEQAACSYRLLLPAACERASLVPPSETPRFPRKLT